MPNLNPILSLLGNAAKLLAPMVVPGAGNILKGAESALAAFNTLKAENGGTAPADAEANHDALFAKVKAHAESTLDRLDGD